MFINNEHRKWPIPAKLGISSIQIKKMTIPKRLGIYHIRNDDFGNKRGGEKSIIMAKIW